VLVAFVLPLACVAKYQPTWESLDARPLPSWFDDSKFGIFVHWGVYSVPSFQCGGTTAEWYWHSLELGSGHDCVRAFHNKTYGADFKYADFARDFRAQLFDPVKWAQLFKKSGAKYVVLTSKHHEGFANWPSPQAWNWNSVDVGPHKDIVGLLTDAVRDAGLVMGLYHSLYEWFNPLYMADENNNGSTTVYVDEILQPQLRDIVNRYKPDVIWSDGDWTMSDTYWKSKEFLAWLYNDSPVRDTVVTNDRWGKNDMCQHGGYLTCADSYNPGVLQPRKWENCLPVDSLSWGYARNNGIGDYRTIAQLLEQLVSTVACNGNLLLNVGPTSDGMIAPIFEERLLQIGTWLEINGEAIYKTKPWKTQNDTSSVWYTAPKSSSNTAYAIFVAWPSDGVVRLTKAVPQSSNMVAQLLGYNGNLLWKQNGNNLAIVLPDTINMSEVLRTQSAGTIKLIGVQ